MLLKQNKAKKNVQNVKVWERLSVIIHIQIVPYCFLTLCECTCIDPPVDNGFFLTVSVYIQT